MRKVVSIIIVLTFSCIMIGCGNSASNLVTNIGIETKEQDNNKYIIVDYKLSIGDSVLPFLHLPLPHNTGAFKSYRINNENFVVLDLNMTEILKAPSGLATLPNGAPIPVGIGEAGIIEIDIPGINGKVYVAYQDEMTMVGFAFSIKQLDELGRSIGSIGVFPSFEINNIKLIAGVFAGATSNQTGLAAFANLGGLWNLQGEELAQVFYQKDVFHFKTKRTSRKKLKKLFEYMYNLGGIKLDLIR